MPARIASGAPKQFPVAKTRRLDVNQAQLPPYKSRLPFRAVHSSHNYDPNQPERRVYLLPERLIPELYNLQQPC